MAEVRGVTVENVTTFTVVYHSGALQSIESFFTFRTYVSRNGVIRLTFERGISESDFDKFGGRYHLPISETYEYRISPYVMERNIFQVFDLLQLQSHPFDEPGCDMGSWELTVQCGRKRHALKGYEAPLPFGRELAEAISRLLAFRHKPMMW